MFWCFSIINRRLAEVYLEKKRGKVEILEHCYVKEKEYKTKKEKQWIKEDSVKFKFTYRNSQYNRLLNN